MKFYKSMIAALTACTLLTGFAACGTQREENTSAPEEPAAEETTAEEATTEEVTTAEETQAPTEAETPEATEEETAAETEAETEAETDTPTEEAATDAPAEDGGYAAAYREIVEAYGKVDDAASYALIDFDGDDVPELVAGHTGYNVSMYTYADGKVWTVMDDWGYGAMGNAGYDYLPGQNYFHNSNADYAGLIRYETYMQLGASHDLETVAVIECRFFDDANGNGMPDEDETDTYSEENAVYILDNGKEITAEEAAAYSREGFESIVGSLTYDEIMARLG